MSDRSMPNPARNSRLVTWPKERFYFAVLDVASLPRGARNDREKLGYLFESTLPIPIEDVAATYAPIGGERVLACGIEKSALLDREWEDALSLVPDGVPEELDIPPGIDLSSLNVLVFEFEPKAVTMRRRLAVRGLIAALIVASALVVFGVEERLSDLRGRASQIESQENLLLDAALGKPRIHVPSGQRRVQLIGELRKLERTRSSTNSAHALEEPDAALLLAELLRVLPDGADAGAEAAADAGADVASDPSIADSARRHEDRKILELDSIRIDESGAELRGTASDAKALSILVSALGRLSSVEVEPPKFQTTPDDRLRFEAGWKSNAPGRAPR